jgi:hypothetical protein
VAPSVGTRYYGRMHFLLGNSGEFDQILGRRLDVIE